MRRAMAVLLATVIPEPGFGQMQINTIVPPRSIVREVTRETEVVDWSAWFPKKIDQQNAGSCHVYSATALVEAFCKKATGQEIDVSEGYYFYLHIREELSKSSAPAEALMNFDFSKLTGEEEAGLFDGGNPRATLERFKSGQTCTKAEFAHIENELTPLIKSLRLHQMAIQPKPKDQEAFVEALKSDWFRSRQMRVLCSDKGSGEIEVGVDRSLFPGLACSRLDQGVRCLVDPKLVDPVQLGQGVRVRTQNQALRQCLGKLGGVETIDQPSNQEIARLLKEGNPVLCYGNFFWPGKGLVGHGVILYGYHKNPKKPPEFLVRDSNFTSTRPFTVTGCDRILVLREK